MDCQSIRPSLLLVILLYLASCNLPAGEGPGTTDEQPAQGPSVTLPVPPPPENASELIQPEDFVYLGAFRLPDGAERPFTFEYGGNAMTFNPAGDPAGAADGFPGSLFVMGHDRMPYGDLPNGGQVAEVSIPAPLQTKDLEGMNSSAFLQDFSEVAAGAFTGLDEIPKTGMLYLDTPLTGPLIHLAWGEHLQPPDAASHAWFSPDLSHPNITGYWFIGNQDPYSTNAYMFGIPTAWAEQYSAGRLIATGRMRDGGQGGMGPTLFAYLPWLADGSPAMDGTHLEETTLLLYENAYNTNDFVRCLDGYQHPDEWEGGAWLTTTSSRSAVLFAGTKSNGTKFWYGYVNPLGPEYACVDTHVSDFPTCRTTGGGICSPEETAGCCNEEAGECVSLRGWWSTHMDAEFILYNPDDLARVAAGEMEPWEPQPYAVLDIDEYLLLVPPEWDEVNLGWGDQRRYRVGDVAFDREHGLLYVLELYADGAKPVVHVWNIR